MDSIRISQYDDFHCTREVRLMFRVHDLKNKEGTLLWYSGQITDDPHLFYCDSMRGDCNFSFYWRSDI